MDNVQNNQEPVEAQNNNKGKARATKNFKDIQIEFLGNGLEAVRAFVDAGEVSPAVVARAARELEDHPMVSVSSYESLASYVDEITVTPEGANGNGRRGKQPPQVGETRSYKAQVTKNSPTPFLRLPLSNLDVSKGDGLRVSFEDGRIVVTRG